MLNTALNTIKKYNMIQKGDTIVVGVSGGADSSALLHFLFSIKQKFNLSIYVIHINHKIRGYESEEDSKFVENFCKNLNIPFKIISHNIKIKAKKWKMGEEETGRKIRYEEFQKISQELGKTKIAVAHNMNDQAETLIMNICRGSGLKGISGILPVRENIIRPLIECDRKKIEKYCEENNILYRTDSTNNIDIYTRNKIRLKIIPLLKEVNKNSIENIARTSSLIYEEEEYLQNISEKEYKKCIIKKDENCIIIDNDYLKSLNIVIIRRILRIALKNLKKDINNIYYKNIENIIDLLNKGTGKKINLPLDIICEIEYKNLKIYKSNIKKSEEYKYILIPEKKIYIKEINRYILLSLKENKKIFNSTNVCTKVFEYDKIKSDIFIRSRKIGDYIKLKNGRKKLKDIFIDCKIPIEMRNTFPILSTDEKIISIIGLRDSIDFYINKNTKTKMYFYIWEEK